jgi:hypothetical protein
MARKSRQIYTETQQATGDGNGLMELGKELWQAAVNL